MQIDVGQAERPRNEFNYRSLPSNGEEDANEAEPLSGSSANQSRND